MAKSPGRVAAGKKLWASKSAAEKAKIISRLRGNTSKASSPSKKVRKTAKAKKSYTRHKAKVPVATGIGAAATAGLILTTKDAAYGGKSFLDLVKTKDWNAAVNVGMKQLTHLENYLPAAGGMGVSVVAKKLKAPRFGDRPI